MRGIEKWWDRMPSVKKFLLSAFAVVIVIIFIQALMVYGIIFLALL